MVQSEWNKARGDGGEGHASSCLCISRCRSMWQKPIITSNSDRWCHKIGCFIQYPNHPKNSHVTKLSQLWIRASQYRSISWSRGVSVEFKRGEILRTICRTLCDACRRCSHRGHTCSKPYSSWALHGSQERDKISTDIHRFPVPSSSGILRAPALFYPANQIEF